MSAERSSPLAMSLSAPKTCAHENPSTCGVPIHLRLAHLHPYGPEVPVDDGGGGEGDLERDAAFPDEDHPVLGHVRCQTASGSSSSDPDASGRRRRDPWTTNG